MKGAPGVFTHIFDAYVLVTIKQLAVKCGLGMMNYQEAEKPDPINWIALLDFDRVDVDRIATLFGVKQKALWPPMERLAMKHDLWRRRCRWWSGCTMHIRRYVSTHTHNLMTMSFVITHNKIKLYPSIESFGIVASGRAAAIFYNIDSVPSGARRQFFLMILVVCDKTISLI